jgi:hypothetical protein
MEDLVTAINALLAMLPEKHRAWVEALMALLWAAGPVLALVRWQLAKRVPAGQARWWLEAFDMLLQAITASSTPLAKRFAPPPKSKEKP